MCVFIRSDLDEPVLMSTHNTCFEEKYFAQYPESLIISYANMKGWTSYKVWSVLNCTDRRNQ